MNKGKARKSAMSYGPFGLWKAVVLGCVVGSLVFFAYQMFGPESEYGYPDQLRTWLAIVGSACGLALISGMVLNYVIGRRVQQEIELSRKLFSRPSSQSPHKA